MPFAVDGNGCSSAAPRWGRAALVVVVFGVVGCDSSNTFTTKSGPLRSKESHPTFVGTGMPTQCSARCIPATVYVARAELGLDPTILGDEFSDDPRTVFRALETQSAATGGVIRSVPVTALLDELQEGPIRPIVLVHKNGHLCLLLGALEVEGQLLYQLVHGDMPVSLVSKDQIVRAGFQEAWRFQKQADGVPIAVGSGALRIDKVCHNFGEVKPEQSVECRFSLTNVGSTTLVMGKPRTSCGCTTTTATENTALRPAETKEIGVTIRSTNSASLKQSVHLTFFEQRSGASRQVGLSLFLHFLTEVIARTPSCAGV